jgi:uncharacterized protein involved in response to NO
MTPVPRLRRDSGPALFSYGFRPFFLFGAFYAALAIALWLPFYFGDLPVPTAFAPIDWHVHEMLFGYLAATITGFLLTAVPNWTGCLPLQGRSLVMLFCVWIVGRLAVASSAMIGWSVAAVLDSAFLFLVVAAAGREIVCGRNWRNLKVLIPVSVLALTNVAFHVEAHLATADISVRVAIGAIILLIMIIGGRIVPSFTRNWLARQNPAGRLPAPFSRFDGIAIAVGAVALVSWAFHPAGPVVGVLLLLAGLLQVVRLARWAGDRTTRDRLVLVLHVAYAFVPIGFVIAASGAVGIVPASAGIHAWMVGAAGMMTLAVMTRATLGHTGRALVASSVTQGLYVLVGCAALLRVAAALEPSVIVLLYLAAAAWSLAFFGFVATFGRALSTPKIS